MSVAEHFERRLSGKSKGAVFANDTSGSRRAGCRCAQGSWWKTSRLVEGLKKKGPWRRARGVVGYHARLALFRGLARGVRFNPGRVHFYFSSLRSPFSRGFRIGEDGSTCSVGWGVQKRGRQDSTFCARSAATSTSIERVPIIVGHLDHPLGIASNKT